MSTFWLCLWGFLLISSWESPKRNLKTRRFATLKWKIAKFVRNRPSVTVSERSEAGPHIVVSVWKNRSRWSETWCSVTPTDQHIIYEIKKGAVWKHVSYSEKRPCCTWPQWCFHFPVPTPPRKTIHNLPKTSPYQDSPSPMCWPRNRFHGQSPFMYQL